MGKARFKLRRFAVRPQKLDRCLRLKQAIRAIGEPYLTHAADSDHFLQFPRAAQLALVPTVQGARAVSAQRTVQQAVKSALTDVAEPGRELASQSCGRMAHHVGHQRLRMRSPEQFAYLLRKLGIAFMQTLDEGGTRQIVAFERFIQCRVDGFPEDRIERVGNVGGI